MEDTTESIGKDQLQPIKKFKRKLVETLLEEVKLLSSPPPTTVSISNAPRPFWTNACLEESALLWSPTQISDSPSSTGSSARWPFIRRKLIPLTESQRLAWRSSLSSQLGSTVCSLTNQHLQRSLQESQVPEQKKSPPTKRAKLDPISKENAKALRLTKVEENRQKRILKAKQKELSAEAQSQQEWTKEELNMTIAFTPLQQQQYHVLGSTEEKVAFWQKWKLWTRWWAKVRDRDVPLVQDANLRQKVIEARDDRKLVSKMLKPHIAQARAMFESNLSVAERAAYDQVSKRAQKKLFEASRLEEQKRSPARVVKCKTEHTLYTQKRRTLPETIASYHQQHPTEESPKTAYTRKIKLNPSPAQRKVLFDYLSAYRFTYNAALYNDRVRDCSLSICRKSESMSSVLENPWLQASPYNLRELALRELAAALKVAKILHPDGHFQMSFKSLKKSRRLTVPMGKRCVFLEDEGVCIFPKTASTAGRIPWSLEPGLLEKIQEALPSGTHGFHPQRDVKLVYDRGKQSFHLCAVLERQKPWAQGGENQATSEPRIIALDPGVRTFLTGYSPSGELLEISDTRGIQRLCRLAHGIDKLRARIDHVKTRAKQRHKFRVAALRQELRISVDEVHWKGCRHLCTDVILIPEFNVKRVVTKRAKDGSWARKISKKLMMRHYQFRQRLIQKAREAGKVLLVVDEAYTSVVDAVTRITLWVVPKCLVALSDG